MSNLTLGSLFDGSGGFPLAAINCGIKPIWASEVEPFPIRVTQKKLPGIKHLGDIKDIIGYKIEPVDIISFGSPCQDLSIAGKRVGLGGAKSNLFFDAIRITKEMRCKTNGKYPRYLIWENVPGAFSSNEGEDFRCVLEEITKVKDPNASMPKPKKWCNSGEIVGDSFSIAWRVLDAKYFGVPQRRRRIFLVADLRGECAGEILFEQTGLPWDTKKSKEKGKRNSNTTEKGINKSICLNDQGGERMDIYEEISGTLKARGGNPPFVYDYTSAHYASNDASSQCETASDQPNTRKSRVVKLLFENHSQDSRYKGPLKETPTLASNLGQGGNNQPFVVYDIRQTSENTRNERHNIYKCEVSRTIDTSGNTPTRNQGGVAIVEDVYSMSKNSHFTNAQKNITSSLVATDYKDPPLVNKKLVRRLTPKECGRLQGFPDYWCENLELENPTKEDLIFWREVFDKDAELRNLKKKKTDKQILKWLKSPHTDSAEYKMWGNGVALPCVIYIFKRLVKSENTT